MFVPGLGSAPVASGSDSNRVVRDRATSRPLLVSWGSLDFPLLPFHPVRTVFHRSGNRMVSLPIDSVSSIRKRSGSTTEVGTSRGSRPETRFPNLLTTNRRGEASTGNPSIPSAAADSLMPSQQGRPVTSLGRAALALPRIEIRDGLVLEVTFDGIGRRVTSTTSGIPARIEHVAPTAVGWTARSRIQLLHAVSTIVSD